MVPPKPLSVAAIVFAFAVGEAVCVRGLRAAEADEELEIDTEEAKAAALKGLIGRLGRSPNDARVAAKRLGQIGSPAVPSLIAALRNGSLQTRFYAGGALAMIDDRRATEALLDVLKSDVEHTWIKRSAARAMGQMSFRPAVPTLLSLARTTADPELKLECTRALGNIRSPESVEFLLKRFGEEEGDEVRVVVIEGLGDLRVAAAVDGLAASLTSPNIQIAEAAVSALGKIGPDARPAVPKLVEVFDRDGKNFRSLVRGALRVITGHTFRSKEGWRAWVEKENNGKQD